MRELTTEQVRWRARWVRALLSGRYEQGHGALCTRPTRYSDARAYCCLGVAAHLVNPDFGGLQFTWNLIVGESDAGTLNESLCAVFGLDDDYNDQETLYGLNDGDRWTFAQIAQGVAYCTSVDEPIERLRSQLNVERDGYTDAIAVPEDFDAGAWAEAVLAS